MILTLFHPPRSLAIQEWFTNGSSSTAIQSARGVIYSASRDLLPGEDSSLGAGVLLSAYMVGLQYEEEQASVAVVASPKRIRRPAIGNAMTAEQNHDTWSDSFCKTINLELLLTFSKSEEEKRQF
jgi:hypothetical protein